MVKSYCFVSHPDYSQTQSFLYHFFAFSSLIACQRKIIMVSSCEARYGGDRNQTQILSLIFVSSATIAATFLTQNRYLFKENSAFIFGQKCPRFENVFLCLCIFLWLVSRCRKSRQLSLQSIYNSLPTLTRTQRPPHPLQMEWLCSL